MATTIPVDNCVKGVDGDGSVRARPNVTAVTTTPELLSLHSVGDLVEIVPSLLGFQPVESLVLVVLERDRVEVTVRFDLAAADQAPRWQLVPVFARFPTATYVVVAYTPEARAGWEALLTMDAAFPELPRTLVLADGERCYLFPGDEGEPYDAVAGRAAVQGALAGMAVLGSREELHAQLDHTWSEEALAAALDAVGAAIANGVDMVARGRELLARFDTEGGSPTLEEAVVLTMASHAPGFLDEAILSTTRANAAARRDLWAAVVRGSAPRCDGFALAALGIAAWVTGQGALQVVCLERMTNIRADPLWMGVLDQANAEAWPPSEWPAVRQRVRSAVARAPEARQGWQRVDLLAQVVGDGTGAAPMATVTRLATPRAGRRRPRAAGRR